MNDVILINEKNYQQIKKELEKADDYFTEKEIEKLRQNYVKR